MNEQPSDNEQTEEKPNFLARLGNTCSAPLPQIALFATSAWLIVIGLKGLAGFPVNQTTAVADLLGILIVVGLGRWFLGNKHKRGD